MLTTLAASISPVFRFSTEFQLNLLKITFINLSKCSSSKLFDDLVAFVQDLLSFIKHFKLICYNCFNNQ